MTAGEQEWTAEAVADAASFADDFARVNGLGTEGLWEWVLHPGMLFGASEMWWGEGGRRPAPHEGLDLCLYRDRRGAVHRLTGGARIPALYDGLVVGAIPDFLGQSVIVRHDLVGGGDLDLCTIYAHTSPEYGIAAGRRIVQGEVVARVAEVSPLRSSAGPHFHLSIALARPGLAYEQLDWAQIGDPETMTLIDPFSFVGVARLFQEGERCPV